MPTPPTPLFTGRFLQLRTTAGGWEYVARTRCTGIVVILAITDDQQLLLVEQHRPPIGRNAIELPAGLVGDTDSSEPFETAVRRELLEETGYACGSVILLAADLPTSSGLTSETLSLYHAQRLTRQTLTPTGDGHESITLHQVPLADLRAFLAAQQSHGKSIDLKIYAALALVGRLVP